MAKKATKPKLSAAPKAARRERADESEISAIVARWEEEDEQLRLIERMAKESIGLPIEGFVVGEAVQVTEIYYDGAVRGGLMARCRRGDANYAVSFAVVTFPEGSPAAWWAANYSSWLSVRMQTGKSESVDVEKPVAPAIPSGDPVRVADVAANELIILECEPTILRCRSLGDGREVTLRTNTPERFPGEIITVVAKRGWRHRGRLHVAADVTASRIDVAALGLRPLELTIEGEWDPAELLESEEPLADWQQEMVEFGTRPMAVFEEPISVSAGYAPDDDPIIEASERFAAGDERGAERILMTLLSRDVRCLDAHAHLGAHAFDSNPELALRHYELGAQIGALSLDPKIRYVLPWGLIENRPYLRCLQGRGLCLWRLGRKEEAAASFEASLWFEPDDHIGIRFLLDELRSGKSFENF